MINRAPHLAGGVPAASSYTDIYELEVLGDTFIVAFSTAAALGREADQRDASDWFEFHDVFGSRHRLPARCAYRISETTRAKLRVVRHSGR